MRLLQVGIGGFGYSWLFHVKNSPDFEPCGYVDIREEAINRAVAEGLAERHLCFSDLSRAIAETDPEVVLVVVPPEAHRQVCEKALGAGCHVLCEKPIAQTMDDAQAMIAAAQRAGKILMISQNYRFRAHARAIGRLLRERALGEVGYVTIEFHKAPQFPGSYRLKMRQPLLIDMSVHHFDLVRYFLADDVRAVRCHSFRPAWSWFDHDPCVMAQLHMQSGVPVSYAAGWVSPGSETTWDGRWRIQCQRGAIIWDEGRVLLAPAEGEVQDHTPDEQTVQRLGSGQPAVLAELAAAIREGRQPETSGEAVLNSWAAVLACVMSAEQSRAVAVDEVMP